MGNGSRIAVVVCAMNSVCNLRLKFRIIKVHIKVQMLDFETGCRLRLLFVAGICAGRLGLGGS